MDSIGLGSALVNLVTVIIVVIALAFSIYFLRKKNKLKAVLVISIVLNIISVVYFTGEYYKYKYLYFTDHTIWPLANLVILIFLIIKKNKKNEEK